MRVRMTRARTFWQSMATTLATKAPTTRSRLKRKRRVPAVVTAWQCYNRVMEAKHGAKREFDHLTNADLRRRIRRCIRLTSTHVFPSARRDELDRLEVEQRRRKDALAAREGGTTVSLVGASVRGRYHDVVGTVVRESAGYEGGELYDVRFPKGTANTGRGGLVKQYLGADLDVESDGPVAATR